MSAAWPSAIAAGWHPLAYARELGPRPLARILMDVPVVLFRGADGAAALVDRCPHRNMPLSGGRVRQQTIACPYHGWRFDGAGHCVDVPGAAASATPCAARARSLHTREAAGLVWVSLADVPAAFPALPGELEDPALDRFWWPLPASRARVLDAVENLLDPAHPHYLHPWLVRRPGARRPVRVRFHGDATGGEARYDEAEVRSAWLPRLFEGRRLTTIGRYLAPTMAQVAFEGEAGISIAVTVVFTPETPYRTRPYAHFATRRGMLPAWLKRALVIAFHRPVLHQDRVALARQADAIERFGGPDFHAGPLDLFGPLIWKLANGQPVAPERRELQLWL